MFFWQPSRVSRTDSVYSRSVALRPAGVVDLTDAFHGIPPKQIYIDALHTNERGAALVAEAMPAAAAALFERIKLFALFTKHRGFHEEREWRIVYLRELDTTGLLTQQLHYAIGPRGIEPRLRFTTDALGGPQAAPRLRDMVQRIILGPVLSTPLALRSVKRMLELFEPAWAGRVTRSTTPYRSQRPWPAT